MGKKETELSELDHYCTPEDIWQPIVDVFGSIDLDPLSNPNSTVPAKVAWTNWTGPVNAPRPEGMVQRDGMVANWDGYGLVFVNGPFSTATEYLKKCATEGDEVIFLCRANMNAKYIHDWVKPASGVLFPSSRVTFQDQTFTAPFHILLGYWGTRIDAWRELAKRLEAWCVVSPIAENFGGREPHA